MNKYEHDITSYLKNTLGLSMEQDGAYRRMLDLYYLSEKPLSLDLDELHRELRCTKIVEKKAVNYCLTRYFEETPEGFIQGRAEEELTKYDIRGETARTNGKRGGRPKGPRDHAPDEPPDPGGQKPIGLSVGSCRDTDSVSDGFVSGSGSGLARGVLSSVGLVLPSVYSASLHKPTAALSARTHARRLPTDWRTSFDYRSVALQVRPHWPVAHIDETANYFSDYWQSKGGRDATKVDWMLTWRNWVRRERDPQGLKPQQGKGREGVAAQIFGEPTSGQPTDITGESRRIA